MRLFAPFSMLLLFILFSSGVLADGFNAKPLTDWKLKKDKKGIQVYTRKIENFKQKAARAETIVSDVNVHAVMAVLLDAEACPEWADLCKESYVHSKNSETDYYVYTNNDLPAPVKNRDALTQVRWKKTPTGSVIMESEAVDGILPPQKGSARIPEAYIRWVFTPTDEGLHIDSWFLIRPGKVPAWLTNQLIVGTPYKTVKGLLEQARKPKYANIGTDFYDQLGEEF